MEEPVDERQASGRCDVPVRSRLAGLTVATPLAALYLSRSSRIAQLDLLRGIAVLLVVMHHTQIDPQATGFFQPFFSWLKAFGGTGVDLFFVLSGFLIGGLLFAELRSTGKIDVRQFLVRRAFKIWPGYIALIAFAFVREMYHGRDYRSAILIVLPNLLQIQNYIGQIIGHTWSIAVEEHFYLLLPVLLFLISRGGNRERMQARMALVPWIAGGLLCLCLTLRCYRVLYSHSTINPLSATEIRIDSMFVGVTLAYLLHFYPEFFDRFRRFPVLLMLSGLLLLSLKSIFPSNSFYYTIGFTACSMGYALVLVALVHLRAEVLPFNAIFGIIGRIIIFIGMYSYSIYLWHLDLAYRPVESVFLHFEHHLSGPVISPALLLATTATAVVVGTLLGIAIERPSLLLRDRLFPRKQAISR